MGGAYPWGSIVSMTNCEITTSMLLTCNGKGSQMKETPSMIVECNIIKAHKWAKPPGGNMITAPAVQCQFYKIMAPLIYHISITPWWWFFLYFLPVLGSNLTTVPALRHATHILSSWSMQSPVGKPGWSLKSMATRLFSVEDEECLFVLP